MALRCLAALCYYRDPDADTTEFEREIDALVYKLYGLNDEEIAVVEGKGK